jgi:hypothetical protein
MTGSGDIGTAGAGQERAGHGDHGGRGGARILVAVA